MDLWWHEGTYKILTVNGNTYVSNAQGYFYNVASNDVAGMISAGCVSRPPYVSDQPVSHYSTPTAGQTVQMYGTGSQTVTVNGHTYTATAAGTFVSVLQSDVAAMEAARVSAEPPYEVYGAVMQYGRG